MRTTLRSDGDGAFPKVPLGRAIGIAKAMRRVAKGVSRDGIAIEMELRPGTGSINNRVIAARKFGLIARGASGGYVLTPLGKRFAVGNFNTKDIHRAVSNVPIFAAALHALGARIANAPESDMYDALRNAGVEETLLEVAARIMMKSLRLPEGDTEAMSQDSMNYPPPDDVKDDLEETAFEKSVRPTAAADPVVRSLLAKTPPPGSEWSLDRVDEWLRLFSSAIRYLYPVPGELEEGKVRH